MLKKETGWKISSPMEKTFVKKYLPFIFILVFLLVFLSCSSNNIINSNGENSSTSDVIVEVPEQTELKKLTEEDKKKIYQNLQVFYTQDNAKWEKARQEILEMGSLGQEALSLFFIKFFAQGKSSDSNTDATYYWQKASSELIRLKEAAMPYLILAMSHPKVGSTVRMQCLRVIVAIGNPAVPILLQNLERGNQKFQSSVLDALASIGTSEAAEEINNLYLKQPRPTIENGEQDDIIHNDPNYFPIRYYCIKALSNIKSEKGLPAVESALDDPVHLIQRKAIQAVLQYNSPQALPALKKAYQRSLKIYPGYYKKIQRKISEIKDL